MRERIPYGHMICTRCSRDAGDPGDVMEGLPVEAVIALCERWLCIACPNETEAHEPECAIWEDDPQPCDCGKEPRP